MADFRCLNFIWKDLFCRALTNIKPYKMSLTQQDNAKLFIMFEKLGCSIILIKIVLETEIQIYELQSAAKMINPVCYISWKSIQSSWSRKSYSFYKTSQFFVMLSGFNFKGITPHASQRTKCY